MTNREPFERQSIWSVASGWLPIYFALFDALGTIGVIYVIGYNVFGRSHPTVHDMVWTIVTNIVIVGAASATISILAVEMGKNVMITGTYLEQMLNRRRARQLAEAEEQGEERGEKRGEKRGLELGLKQGLEQGAIKGRAGLSAEVREWNERRLAAQAEGEPFDEPPPGLNG